MSLTPYSELIIDLEHIAYNYNYLNRLSKARCGAVIKANAYGMGAVLISHCLYQAGCRDFFVAFMDEAKEIRPHLPLDARIYLLYGPYEDYKETDLADIGIIPILNSLKQIEDYNNLGLKRGKKLPYGLHVDTGMHRISMSEKEYQIYRQKHFNALDLIIIMSHLASAEEPESLQNIEQLNKFKSIRSNHSKSDASFSNSSGIFLDQEYHFDVLRPGIALYGLTPKDKLPGLKNCVTLRAKVLQIQELKPGDRVSYSGTYVAQKPMQVASIAIGYADGLPWSLSNRGWKVKINDYECEVIGRVTMDLTMVDVTNVPCEAGDWATVVDEERDFIKMSQLTQRLPYELLITLGHRLQRRYTVQNFVKAA